MNLDYLKETSNTAQDLVNENIEVGLPTDEIINAIIEQKRYSSLAYQIAEVSPIHGPTAATFALIFEDGKVKLKRGEVTVEDDALEDTGFTIEALQDLQNQYGKSMVDYIGRSFSGVSSMKENTKLIAKLSQFAVQAPSMTLSDPANAESSIFEIQQKVAELVIAINSSTYKSLDSFVVLPAAAAASMLAVSNRLPENKKEFGLFLGSNSRTDFYLNPDMSSVECFVGIKSPVPGQSSLIFSPYTHQLQTVVDPETGNTKIFNYNRYAISESKLSELQNMVYKFEISNGGSIPNQAPTADAGSDATGLVGDLINLSGTGSSDPEGATLSYKWTITGRPAGSVIDLDIATASTTSFTPDVAGTYFIQLVVGDGDLYSSASIVKAVIS